ncbi:MAG TPA: sodium:proton antiporter [Syntrophorhabdaceae bacterium]|nr:sodium:proton antiporter [Syntrophorhabdaceae bacterium]HQE79705.1 sodium:proton antiporter [Syntrophorhabdaceae bacterium]
MRPNRLFLLINLFLLGIAPEIAFASSGASISFPIWTVLFFTVLILSIAVMPLINSEWWGNNYRYVSIGLAIPAAVIVVFKDFSLLLHAIIEYISFIILLGSLFVISGGIVIRISARGKPLLNSIILFIGAVFASFIGTTGASMVLIRPLIKVNRWRKNVSHIFIFFIFLVSNIGGLLTPLGDPPLFLGFLKGVPFTWTFRLLPFWVITVCILIILFYVFDRHYIKKEQMERITSPKKIEGAKKLEIRGKINFLFLGAVLFAFFLPAILREIVMIAAAVLSVYFTPVVLREENGFTYHPIIEVAVLFIGIFVTMIPALKILEVNGDRLGVDTPWKFFWATGVLSSFLDNAPTYLVFMSTAKSLAVLKNITAGLVAGVPEVFLKAISAGAVFMGANTYVGNGPNFMVKAICEENDITMPSFFRYMLWSVAILVPIFIIITFLFFR